MLKYMRRIKKMKKTIIIVFIALMLISSVFAFEDLGKGEYLLTETEFSQVSDEAIAQYMANNFNINNVKINNDKLLIYYNIIVIEPSNEQYQVKNIDYKTILDYNDFVICEINNNFDYCIDGMIFGTETYQYEENNKTLTYKSTNQQAIDFALSKYEQAIDLKQSISKKQKLNQIINTITTTTTTL
jgi:hypothetical protein